MTMHSAVTFSLDPRFTLSFATRNTARILGVRLGNAQTERVGLKSVLVSVDLNLTHGFSPGTMILLPHQIASERNIYVHLTVVLHPGIKHGPF